MAGSRLVLLSFLCAAGGAVLLDQTPAHQASSNPHLGNRESIRAGMALYRVRCGDCHGLDATGYRGPDLTAILSGGINDERLFDVIRRGVPGTDMPPTKLTDAETWQLVHFIRHLPEITPDDLAQMEALNPKSRKEVDEAEDP